MSVPDEGGLDYNMLGHLSRLTNLSELHGKFVARHGVEDAQALSHWFRNSRLSEIVPKENAVLKLHQVPEWSDWMPYDGDVSCVSGDECEHCMSLLGDLSAFDTTDAALLHVSSDDEFFDAESDVSGHN